MNAHPVPQDHPSGSASLAQVLWWLGSGCDEAFCAIDGDHPAARLIASDLRVAIVTDRVPGGMIVTARDPAGTNVALEPAISRAAAARRIAYVCGLLAARFSDPPIRTSVEGLRRALLGRPVADCVACRNTGAIPCEACGGRGCYKCQVEGSDGVQGCPWCWRGFAERSIEDVAVRVLGIPLNGWALYRALAPFSGPATVGKSLVEPSVLIVKLPRSTVVIRGLQLEGGDDVPRVVEVPGFVCRDRGDLCYSPSAKAERCDSLLREELRRE